MIIELNDLLTIEDKEYAVKNITKVKNKTYYFLINIDNMTDFKFCFLEDNEFYEELDKDNIIELIKNIKIDYKSLGVDTNEFKE